MTTRGTSSSERFVAWVVSRVAPSLTIAASKLQKRARIVRYSEQLLKMISLFAAGTFTAC
jgi:hypothetical protein